MKIKIFFCAFFILLNSFSASALPSCSTTIPKRNKLFPKCNPLCVTLINDIDVSKISNKTTLDKMIKSAGIDILVSRWDTFKGSLRQHDAFIMHKKQQASFWVCPGDKITTSFHLYEIDSIARFYYTRETHCAIFNPISNNKSPLIDINGVVKTVQIVLDWDRHTITNVNYSTIGVNKIGSFKGDEDPPKCTPNSHPGKPESSKI